MMGGRILASWKERKVEHTFHIMQKGYTVCPENWGMVNESALYYRFYYVYGGSAWVCKDDRIMSLKEGYLYIFPMMNPYSLWHDPKYPLDVLWFHVEMAMGAFPRLTWLSVSEESVMRHLLEGMRGIVERPGYGGELAQLFSVFLTVLNEEVPFREAESGRLKQVLRYMEAHIGESVRVQELADFSGMERSYFSRKFKEVFRMPPQKYLVAMKMSVAARRLLGGDSVRRAAEAVGYADEKAFSRAFKAYMEMAPGKYRKRHSGIPPVI